MNMSVTAFSPPPLSPHHTIPYCQDVGLLLDEIDLSSQHGDSDQPHAMATTGVAAATNGGGSTTAANGKSHKRINSMEIENGPLLGSNPPVNSSGGRRWQPATAPSPR